MIAFALNYSKAALPQRNMAETAEAQILRRKRKIQNHKYRQIFFESVLAVQSVRDEINIFRDHF
jgi:hypothetical protein